MRRSIWIGMRALALFGCDDGDGTADVDMDGNSTTTGSADASPITDAAVTLASMLLAVAGW
jgi:hypothetical protein